jgi:hypothetical protein
VGDWEALSQALAAERSWADYIQADAYEDFPRFPLDRRAPGGLPLLNFPEISMWGQSPWGGYGANPLPARFQRLWDQTDRKLAGGTPYSEGIYEDMNKAICAQFYWDPEHPALATVCEYAAFEYSPDVAEDVVKVVQAFEKNHQRGEIGASAEQTFLRVKEINGKLEPRVRGSWRQQFSFWRGVGQVSDLPVDGVSDSARGQRPLQPADQEVQCR